MNQSPLPPPLTHASFYVLLALAHGQAHGYAIGAIAHNHSLSSLPMPDGKVYPLLKKLLGIGLIEEAGLQPTDKSTGDKMYYRLTKAGEFRLKEEFQRLQHAIEIADRANLINNEVPIEIQKMLDAVR
jgi:DNA-binding PadR family transcriptional regulator